jgi:SynChlorMet cassette protein ScmD
VNVTDKPIANLLVVLREEFDDWAVLFNPDTAAAVGINPVGVEVGKHTDGTHTVAQLIAHVRATFANAPETADAEITTFVEDLVNRGFVGLSA